MRVEEHRIQRQIVEYLTLNHVEVFAIPNGGHRDVATATILKREGVRRGAPDLMIIGKSKIYFVEVKTQKGKQSEYQKIFEQIASKSNACYYMLWRSLNDAIDFFEKNKKDVQF